MPRPYGIADKFDLKTLDKEPQSCYHVELRMRNMSEMNRFTQVLTCACTHMGCPCMCTCGAALAQAEPGPVESLSA